MRPLRKVTYVEDDADIREVAVLALELVGGFEVQTCSSGEEAVARAAAFGPDLLLLDVMMSPGMDGPATLARLRENPALAATPVIFMTARVQPRDVAALRALGALDVIAKPFDPMTLADTMRAIWDARGTAG